MSLLNRKESLVLFLGDLGSFVVALWLSLFFRSFEIPSRDLFLTHLLPFSLLFVLWILVFYIAGLYEKHTVILKSKLPSILANTQIANSTLAVVFFYFVPFFGITPKTILFIYLLVSFVLILSWRIYGYFVIGHGHPTNAILIGSGDEMKELLEEVNNNSIYNIKFISSVDLSRADEKGFWDEIISHIYSEDVSVIAIDLANKNVEPVLPHLYNLIFSKISFIDMHKIYEDIFDRVPLSLVKYDWFLENISARPRGGYDALKRLMDIVISTPLLFIPMILYPFLFVAMKLEDRGSIFTYQDRIGRNNHVIRILKFRTMLFNDNGDWQNKGMVNRVTRVGNFLRKTRLDEFPQLWNVLKGDISLIGPRPEFPEAVKHYTDEISYYNVRHLIKPGLSGWAQIYQDKHPHHGLDSLETANKLSYDLYYIKNRSFLLDIKIALRTLKTLASIAGR
ncbi:MAG: sugar transferase [Candidatus Azambacteria bacterium GW2011_GWF2_42_22]|nr:MAG: sugar transferase [Candidatus Azambacteria bacterium GW2011_GWF2_42_22]KKT12678.1 MAG: sugar transferase [Parcubacteria group bacterium GW2011_GWC1_43_30]KKT84980.1 MAG: sugar transferase [Parcubacteria group bacterium GW2011_GWD1_44_9]